MNSLKIINKEIKKQTNELLILKREKAYYETLNKIEEWIIGYDEQIHNTNLKIEIIEYNLNCLQQIKDDLETWETLRRNFKIGIDRKTNKIYVSGKDYYGYESCVFGLFKQDTNIINKVLEKKEDNND